MTRFGWLNVAAYGARASAQWMLKEGTFHFASPTHGCVSGGRYLTVSIRTLGGIVSTNANRSEPFCRFTCLCGMQNPWMPWFQFRSCFTHCHVINHKYSASLRSRPRSSFMRFTFGCTSVSERNSLDISFFDFPPFQLSSFGRKRTIHPSLLYGAINPLICA